jgi:hypothetical protein
LLIHKKSTISCVGKKSVINDLFLFALFVRVARKERKKRKHKNTEKLFIRQNPKAQRRDKKQHLPETRNKDRKTSIAADQTAGLPSRSQSVFVAFGVLLHFFSLSLSSTQRARGEIRSGEKKAREAGKKSVNRRAFLRAATKRANCKRKKHCCGEKSSRSKKCGERRAVMFFFPPSVRVEVVSFSRLFFFFIHTTSSSLRAKKKKRTDRAIMRVCVGV